MTSRLGGALPDHLHKPSSKTIVTVVLFGPGKARMSPPDLCRNSSNLSRKLIGGSPPTWDMLRKLNDAELRVCMKPCDLV